MVRFAAFVSALLMPGLPFAWAGSTQIVHARYERTGAGLYTFHVTLRHDDEGWDHYADKWQVLSLEGDVLGERVLLHPHVDEQPFTRSQSGIAAPEGTGEVVIRAHDTVHGWSGDEVRLHLAPAD